ncbi:MULTISPECIES: twin-arginine translocase subunit TatC [Acidithiobacillus]|jgi:sec-independent protein translocase protein TatC|uniref:Sec-independent protein translocase protein TatC n=3 Tax=Acidithiobacillus caldus TaxID=33059 RepID=F9ZPE8_ACICS|nr:MULTISPECIES: twin-arginine translocase subunit TatC [Acidithiobacillus]AEK56997.1 Twin-arginine translocation protein TatC [Acidithiobacillus caldus SM-1]AIA54263.1 Twin-arginine translocation protein TatC [Acidithiobacillus caldus ATCC 51756]AUW31789.1 twin-arginine translocase subunit TatC [Acidithiobacillus caldus]MBU2730172.1 twin-arginine translocase subunit TatC [Acidithiobacillus caldus]MBU2734635.1 twin-arginine translocase subunit TatC [Acidithiobacillus caldus ATCC 51756]
MATIPDSSENTFVGHLLELRRRVLYAVLAIFIGFLISYPFAQQIYTILAQPLTRLLPAGSHLIYTSLPEVFLTYVQLSLISGFVLALPVVLYQFWAFVAPGLYVHERRLFFPLIFVSLALFIVGVLFAYFVVFPNAFRFFLSFSGTDITAMPKVDNYLSLIVKFSLAFGLAFQIPVLIVVLVRVGILQIDTLRRGRRYAFLICAVAAAILSPPDVMSMVLLLIPMYLLFEIGLFFAARVAPRPWAEEGNAAGVDSAQETDTAAAMDAAEASFHRDEQRPSDREP